MTFDHSCRMWGQLDETLAVPEVKEKVIKLGKNTSNEPEVATCPRSEMICGRFEVWHITSIQIFIHLPVSLKLSKQLLTQIASLPPCSLHARKLNT